MSHSNIKNVVGLIINTKGYIEHLVYRRVKIPLKKIEKSVEPTEIQYLLDLLPKISPLFPLTN